MRGCEVLLKRASFLQLCCFCSVLLISEECTVRGTYCTLRTTTKILFHGDDLHSVGLPWSDVISFPGPFWLLPSSFDRRGATIVGLRASLHAAQYWKFAAWHGMAWNGMAMDPTHENMYGVVSCIVEVSDCFSYCSSALVLFHALGRLIAQRPVHIPPSNTACHTQTIPCQTIIQEHSGTRPNLPSQLKSRPPG